MSQISAQELKTLLDKGDDVQIIDIREIHEVDSGTIGGTHIPMAQLIERSAEIRRNIPVVIHCKSGSRASAMVHILRTEKAFDNVFLLEGGIEAWARDIDPTVTVY